MKPRSKKSEKPFDASDSAPNFLGAIAPEALSPSELVPVSFPPFPKFPTVEELLAHQAGTAAHPLVTLTEVPPPAEPASLFEGLLGGRLEVLQQDALDHPERYSEETREALAALRVGTPRDAAAQKLLDRATVDFASARPLQVPKSIESPKTPPAKKPKLLEMDLEDSRAPQIETPDGPMAAYWWL